MSWRKLVTQCGKEQPAAFFPASRERRDLGAETAIRFVSEVNPVESGWAEHLGHVIVGCIHPYMWFVHLNISISVGVGGLSAAPPVCGLVARMH